MAGFVPLPRAVGETQPLAGFFTQARYLRMQTAAELERRLGYRAGRLRDGYWLMFLLQMPTVQQFEYRGYSQMSGGIAQGHRPEHANDPNAENLLKAGGYNLTGTATQKEGMKHRTLRDTFTLSGHLRLAKLRPVARAHGDPDVADYPPGSGIPQWELVAPLPFVAAAFVAPGGAYDGMYQTPTRG